MPDQDLALVRVLALGRAQGQVQAPERARELGADQAPALEQVLALAQAQEQAPVLGQGVCSRSTPCLASGLEQARSCLRHAHLLLHFTALCFIPAQVIPILHPH